jgi:hypothetical protein
MWSGQPTFDTCVSRQRNHRHVACSQPGVHRSPLRLRPQSSRLQLPGNRGDSDRFLAGIDREFGWNRLLARAHQAHRQELPRRPQLAHTDSRSANPEPAQHRYPHANRGQPVVDPSGSLVSQRSASAFRAIPGHESELRGDLGRRSCAVPTPLARRSGGHPSALCADVRLARND